MACEALSSPSVTAVCQSLWQLNTPAARKIAKP